MSQVTRIMGEKEWEEQYWKFWLYKNKDKQMLKFMVLFVLGVVVVVDDDVDDNDEDNDNVPIVCE